MKQRIVFQFQTMATLLLYLIDFCSLVCIEKVLCCLNVLTIKYKILYFKIVDFSI